MRGLLLCILFCLTAEGKEIVGKVVQMEGQMGTLTTGSSIYVGDKIELGAGGRAELQLTDGSLLSLVGATIFVIHDYVYQTQKEARLQLLLGKCKISGKSAFQIDTPLATITALGTYLIISYEPGRLDVGCLEGNAYIRNVGGSIYIGKDYATQYVSVESIASGKSPYLFSSLEPEKEENFIWQENKEEVGAPQAVKKAPEGVTDTIHQTESPDQVPLK